MLSNLMINGSLIFYFVFGRQKGFSRFSFLCVHIRSRQLIVKFMVHLIGVLVVVFIKEVSLTFICIPNLVPVTQ